MSPEPNCLIREHATILEALRAINGDRLQIALVVDPADRLLGTVADGDVRRGLLRGISLDAPVGEIMNRHPVVARAEDGNEAILAVMREKSVRQIPIVDDTRRVLGLRTLDEILGAHHLENWVVLMAGGRGTRLHPLTADTPKPLLDVGGKPLLETILQGFVAAGFWRIFISLGYKPQMIEAYFGHGHRWNAAITYLRESERRGTAGALASLPRPAKHPVVVMNGDILTNVDFRQLLEFHGHNDSMLTVAVRTFEHEVPFGVVSTEDHRVVDLEEKPVSRYLVNAGIYVLEDAALDLVPAEGFFDMTDLIKAVMAQGGKVAAFPVHEYWRDIGSPGDLSLAEEDYDAFFS